MAPRSPNIQPQKMKLMNTITLGSSALLLMNRGINYVVDRRVQDDQRRTESVLNGHQSHRRQTGQDQADVGDVTDRGAGPKDGAGKQLSIVVVKAILTSSGRPPGTVPAAPEPARRQPARFRHAGGRSPY